ncbi:MAG: hypothetical protein NC200_04980 [Candidatus Gastranaerophilales bacterium]|nr:hypothetical protein [Candidatus Gastranaerophilales bacterium]
MSRFKFCDEKLYYIGGIVRDEILHQDSFDVDITYVGNAIEYCKNLEKKAFGKILKINEPFGTVKMLIDNQEVDVASTRNEIYEKKGHLPLVQDIGCSLKEDVLRRDFTVNALAKSLMTGEIIDYTGGLQDIETKTLRVLHDNSFVDDPTRIVRGLKFSVRFDFHLEEHTKNLQDKYLENINYDMSYKRLKKELIETFNLNSQKAFELFFEQNIYKLLSPEKIVPADFDIETLVKNNPVENIWLVYLGFMNLENLPLTKEESGIIDDYNSVKCSELPQDDYEIYKLFSGKAPESILLYIINVNQFIGMRYLEIKDISLNINGEDLKSLGITPSPEYSKCFDYVLKHKLDNPSMSKAEELQLAKKFFS